MSDMAQVIIPRSDQINADDLLSGPITIKITDVKVSAGQEQPVSIYFEGSTKAYRCCKSMARVLVSAWGADSAKYIGRSLTLYCDPKVKWGGMEVGGIRISHMSDIDSAITMALTVTRANKKPFTVRPIVTKAEAPQGKLTPSAETVLNGEDQPADASATVTDAQLIASIAVHIGKSEWDDARDIARSLKSEVNKKNVLERIGTKESEAAIP